jgi:hypothetical protein
MLRSLATIGMVLTVAAALCGNARAADEATRWYRVEMMDKPVGVMKSWQDKADGGITTHNRMRFEIKRGAVEIKIEMLSAFTESPEGKPLKMRSEQKMGAIPLIQEYEFVATEVKNTTIQGDQKSTRSLPLPQGEWLTPRASEEFVRLRLKAGAKEIVTRSVDPQNGITPIVTTRTIQGVEKLTLGGREVETTRTSVKLSNAPGIEGKEWFDAEGVMVKGVTQMGGIAVSVTLSDEAGAGEGIGQSLAPDMFTSTFITPDKPIADARHLQRGLYRLSMTQGELPDLPTTGSQSFTRESKEAGLVTIVTSGFTPAPVDDVNSPAYLASTALCDIRDDKVLALAERAIKKLDASELADSAKVAEACRTFVYGFISKKSLGVGFASAGEVAKTREGDCSEHGVLLCALLRAHKIPARVATGLIYADQFAGSQNIFGYHMWAQALLTIDGKPTWVDLDATLPPSVPYDATHITLGTNDLADGDGMQSMISLATMMGRLKIEVKN